MNFYFSTSILSGDFIDAEIKNIQLPFLPFLFFVQEYKEDDLRGTIGRKKNERTLARFNSNVGCVGQVRYSFERDGCVYIKRVSPSA